MQRRRKVTVRGVVWILAGSSPNTLVAFAICEENMEQKWTNVLVLLVFYQKMASGDHQKRIHVKEGVSVDIHCQTNSTGSRTLWFRVLDKSGMEFISSYSKDTENLPSSEFNYSKINKNILTLKRFSRKQDSGLYSCATLLRGRELGFGPVTQLFGDKVAQKPTVPRTTPRQQPVTSVPACPCDDRKTSGIIGHLLFCTTLILGPLAGGCGLLLLLLIVTTLYCNKIRTRRCPHHYKRNPRGKPGNK